MHRIGQARTREVSLSNTQRMLQSVACEIRTNRNPGQKNVCLFVFRGSWATMLFTRQMNGKNTQVAPGVSLKRGFFCLLGTYVDVSRETCKIKIVDSCNRDPPVVLSQQLLILPYVQVTTNTFGCFAHHARLKQLCKTHSRRTNCKELLREILGKSETNY